MIWAEINMKKFVIRISTFITIIIASINIGNSKGKALPSLPATNDLLTALYKNKTNKLDVAACNNFLKGAVEKKSTPMIITILNPPPKEKLIMGKPENFKPDQSGMNEALMEAVINGSDDIVRMLLAANIKPDQSGMNSAFEKAVEMDKADIAITLLKNAGIKPEQSYVNAGLAVAVGANKPELAEKLLANDGIKPDQDTINNAFNSIISSIEVLSAEIRTLKEEVFFGRSAISQGSKRNAAVRSKWEIKENLWKMIFKILESPTKPARESIEGALKEALDSKNAALLDKIIRITLDISDELLAEAHIIAIQKDNTALAGLIKNKLTQQPESKNKLKSALTVRVAKIKARTKEISDILKTLDKRDDDDRKQGNIFKEEREKLKAERTKIESINTGIV